MHPQLVGSQQAVGDLEKPKAQAALVLAEISLSTECLAHNMLACAD